MSKWIYLRIVGIGSYLLEKVLINVDLEKMVEILDEWIQLCIGICEWYIVVEGEIISDFGYNVVLCVFEVVGIDVLQFDMIVVGMIIFDFIFLFIVCLIQVKFGVVGCFVFDVNVVCFGFVFVFGVVDKFICFGDCKYVLVIGIEMLICMVDWNDCIICVLFGDGVGVVVFKVDEEIGIFSIYLYVDGSKKELLWNLVGVLIGFKDGVNGGGIINMKGNDVFKYVVKVLDLVVDEILVVNGLDKFDLDWLILYQVNLCIIEVIVKCLDMFMDQVVVIVDKYGNILFGLVLLVLDVVVWLGRVECGQLLLLEVFGGGFMWGLVLLCY